MKITFICDTGDEQLSSQLSTESTDVLLEEVVNLFKAFLITIGYLPDVVAARFDDEDE